MSGGFLVRTTQRDVNPQVNINNKVKGVRRHRRGCPGALPDGCGPPPGIAGRDVTGMCERSEANAGHPIAGVADWGGSPKDWRQGPPAFDAACNVAAAKGSGRGSTGSLKVQCDSHRHNEKDHDQWKPE